MPLLIIAGMPTSVTNRNKEYLLQLDDWDIQLIPSRDKKRPDLQSCWSTIRELASTDIQGAHVFAYHYRQDEYPMFNRKMLDRHRLVWMARDSLRYYGSEEYTTMIKDHVNFECKWRNMLRPQGVDAPGILPESSFLPKKCEDMWSRIRSICLNSDDLGRVFKLMRHFRETHYLKGRWEDKRGLLFESSSARHGSHPKYGNFKFTYQLPEGFHYDVRMKTHNNGFNVKDVDGHLHQFRTYTNISAHGSIRGGR